MGDTASVESVPLTGMAKSRQVAEYLLTTQQRLARQRSEGHGPKYVKLGRSVRYRWQDVHAWVDANVQDTTEGPR